MYTTVELLHLIAKMAQKTNIDVNTTDSTRNWCLFKRLRTSYAKKLLHIWHMSIYGWLIECQTMEPPSANYRDLSVVIHNSLLAPNMLSSWTNGCMMISSACILSSLK